MSSNVNEEKSKTTTLELNDGPTESPSPYRIPEVYTAVIRDCDEFVDQYKKGIIKRWPHTRRFKDEFMKQLERILQQQKHLSNRISEQLKVWTAKSNMHQAKERGLEKNDEPTLLSRMNSEKVLKKKRGSKN
jgi:hypothetical protein